MCASSLSDLGLSYRGKAVVALFSAILRHTNHYISSELQKKCLKSAAILIMATVNHFMLSQLSKLARLEVEMSRNIDFYALLAPEMAGITFVAFDQQP